MRKYILLLAGISFLQFSYASGAGDVDTTINLGNAVITSTKMNVNRNNVPMSISVIEREAIESSSESALLPVLSKMVPGMFVTEKGVTGFGVSAGSAGSVNIRGVGQGNKVLMLFDGQPQWAGIFGHSLPDTYRASDVERVEVIRGPGSLLYGSNAMGGVVNIITRHQDREGYNGQARLMYGSYNTQKYMVNSGYNSGKLSAFVSVNHDRTDGHRDNSDFKITNGFGKVAYKINGNYALTGDVSLAKYKSQNPGTVNAPMLDNIMEVLRGTASVSLDNEHEKHYGALKLFYNWGDHDINDGYVAGAGSPRDYIFHLTDHNYGAMLYQSFRLFKGNEFTVGADLKNWGGKTWNAYYDTRGDVTGVDRDITEAAGYAIMQHRFWNMLTLNAGVRYEDNSAFGGEWIPQGGLVVNALPGNIIKGSVSKGFRSPNIREMYLYNPANPGLKPESMMNYEISVGQSMLKDRLYAEVTAFFIDGKDMIQTIPVDNGSGGTRPMNMNVGTFINKGIEFEAGYILNKEWRFDANYSYLHTNKPIVAAPRNKAFVMATYSPGKLTLSVSGESVTGLYTNLESVSLSHYGKRTGYFLLDAKASYLFGERDRGINVFAKGENLTDAPYSINAGFPMPGIVVMGGMDIMF